MPSGIVLLDKPEGLSSNGALQRVRRLLKASKAGHAGSLDPLATGMLPICLDEATKIAGEILSSRKRYRFTIGLGVRTATGDREGEVIERSAVPELPPARIEAALGRFRGPGRQIPPMYSALKRDGRPLYELARSGVVVERQARPIEIFELRLLGCRGESLDLETHCSKGTYVRTLAEDIARELGTCGYLTMLRRLCVEPFDDEPMQTLESLTLACEGGETPRILPADWPLEHLPAVRLEAEQAERIRHGQPVALAAGTGATGKVRLYGPEGGFFGIGEADGRGNVRPKRLFNVGGAEPEAIA
jgi:tRNA pseudouridine55 synthase